jgi:hypothetical protein
MYPNNLNLRSKSKKTFTTISKGFFYLNQLLPSPTLLRITIRRPNIKIGKAMINIVRPSINIVGAMLKIGGAMIKIG